MRKRSLQANCTKTCVITTSNDDGSDAMNKQNIIMTIVNISVVSDISSSEWGSKSDDNSNSCRGNTINVLSLLHILALH